MTETLVQQEFRCSRNSECRYNALKLSFLVSVIYLILNSIFNFVGMLPYRGAFNPIFLPYLFTWTFGFYIAEVECGRAKLPTQFKIILLISIPLLIVIEILGFNELIPLCSAIVFGGGIYYSVTPKGNQFYNSYIGRYLAWIGLFSYSIFAFHVPLLLLFFYSFSPNGQKFTSFYPVLLISLFVIFVSYFLFLLVEKWTLQSITSNQKS
jgi:peptidoglycan/LPS O-acetylase OafA/YrhL